MSKDYLYFVWLLLPPLDTDPEDGLEEGKRAECTRIRPARFPMMTRLLSSEISTWATSGHVVPIWVGEKGEKKRDEGFLVLIGIPNK